MIYFFKDFFIYGFASILGKLAAIFLIPIYTNVLSKEEYGAMALIVACKGIIDLFSNLNIHSGISRDYYENGIDRKKLVSTGLFSILSISTTILLIVIVSTSYITERILEIPNFKDSFLLMALSIPAGSLMSYFSILTRYKKKPVIFTLGILIQLAIQISISIVGVVYMKYGVVSIFAGILWGEIFATIFFAIINIEYIGFVFEKKYLKRALIFALPTLPAILAGWVDSSMGQIIVGKYISVSELAVYSLALQMASIFTIISTAFQNVWFPYLFENYQSPLFLKEASNLFAMISMILLFVTILFSLFSKEIVMFLSNDGYLEAALYFPLLCIPMSFYMLFPIVNSGIQVSRETKYVGISYVVGSTINVLVIIALIRHLGVFAIPIALSVSRLFTFEYMRRKSNRRLNIVCPITILISIIFVAIIAFVINLFEVKLYIRILIGCSCVFFMYYCYAGNYGIKKLSILFKKKNM